MNKVSKVSSIFTCIIIIIILSGFPYAYLNKINTFNETKRYLQSLGYEISNNITGIAISTFIEVSGIVPMVDLPSFIAITRQINSTIIYEENFRFYVVTALAMFVTAYEYTPSTAIWWNLGIE